MTSDTVINQEKLRKEEEYKKYINTHKENILKMHELLQRYGSIYLTITMYDDTNKDMLERLNKHDDSKYSKEEFDAYRIKFYTTEEEENKIKTSAEYANMVKTNYENALQHHYKYNTHHPQHYVNSDGSIKDMSVKDVYEMILDWMAISYYKHNITTKELVIYYAIYHYKTNRFPFSDNTRKLVDHYMKILMHLTHLMDCHFGLSL